MRCDGGGPPARHASGAAPAEVVLGEQREDARDVLLELLCEEAEHSVDADALGVPCDDGPGGYICTMRMPREAYEKLSRLLVLPSPALGVHSPRVAHATAMRPPPAPALSAEDLRRSGDPDHGGALGGSTSTPRTVGRRGTRSATPPSAGVRRSTSREPVGGRAKATQPGRGRPRSPSASRSGSAARTGGPPRGGRARSPSAAQCGPPGHRGPPHDERGGEHSPRGARDGVDLKHTHAHGDTGSAASGPTRPLSWVLKLLDEYCAYRVGNFLPGLPSIASVKWSAPMFERRVGPSNIATDDVSKTLFQFLHKKFGLDALVMKAGTELLRGIKAALGDLEVAVFHAALTSNEYDTVDIFFYLTLRAALLPFASKVASSRRMVSAAQVSRAIRKGLAPYPQPLARRIAAAISSYPRHCAATESLPPAAFTPPFEGNPFVVPVPSADVEVEAVKQQLPFGHLLAISLLNFKALRTETAAGRGGAAARGRTPRSSSRSADAARAPAVPHSATTTQRTPPRRLEPGEGRGRETLSDENRFQYREVVRDEAGTGTRDAAMYDHDHGREDTATPAAAAMATVDNGLVSGTPPSRGDPDASEAPRAPPPCTHATARVGEEEGCGRSRGGVSPHDRDGWFPHMGGFFGLGGVGGPQAQRAPDALPHADVARTYTASPPLSVAAHAPSPHAFPRVSSQPCEGVMSSPAQPLDAAYTCAAPTPTPPPVLPTQTSPSETWMDAQPPAAPSAAPSSHAYLPAHPSPPHDPPQPQPQRPPPGPVGGARAGPAPTAVDSLRGWSGAMDLGAHPHAVGSSFGFTCAGAGGWRGGGDRPPQPPYESAAAYAPLRRIPASPSVLRQPSLAGTQEGGEGGDIWRAVPNSEADSLLSNTQPLAPPQPTVSAHAGVQGAGEWNAGGAAEVVVEQQQQLQQQQHAHPARRASATPGRSASTAACPRAEPPSHAPVEARAVANEGSNDAHAAWVPAMPPQPSSPTGPSGAAGAAAGTGGVQLALADLSSPASRRQEGGAIASSLNGGGYGHGARAGDAGRRSMPRDAPAEVDFQMTDTTDAGVGMGYGKREELRDAYVDVHAPPRAASDVAGSATPLAASPHAANDAVLSVPPPSSAPGAAGSPVPPGSWRRSASPTVPAGVGCALGGSHAPAAAPRAGLMNKEKEREIEGQLRTLEAQVAEASERLRQFAASRGRLDLGPPPRGAAGADAGPGAPVTSEDPPAHAKPPRVALARVDPNARGGGGGGGHIPRGSHDTVNMSDSLSTSLLTDAQPSPLRHRISAGSAGAVLL